MKIAFVAYHVDSQLSQASPASSARSAAPHCAERDCADQAAHVRGLMKALAAQGHRVTLYARKDAAQLPDTVAAGRGLTIRYLQAGPQAPVPVADLPAYLGTFGSELSRWLRRTAPDVVHAQHWTSGLAALIATRESRVPVVQSFGSLDVAERRAGRTGPQDSRRARMEASVAKAAAVVVAATEEEAADLASLGVPGSRVRIVPPGVDLTQFGQGKAIRRRRTQRLLVVGLLDADQRTDSLIRALPGLPGAEQVIVGGPAPAEVDRDCVCQRLGKLAAELGVADRVTFAGKVGDSELAVLLRSASLLVSTARYEPLGRAAISAMASGVPVVAPAVGAYADAVIDGTTGLLLSPARPEQAGRLLHDLLATPMRLSAFGVAAADRAASRYGWGRIAAETEVAYERVLLAAAIPPARQAAPAASAFRVAA